MWIKTHMTWDRNSIWILQNHIKVINTLMLFSYSSCQCLPPDTTCSHLLFSIDHAGSLSNRATGPSASSRPATPESTSRLFTRREKTILTPTPDLMDTMVNYKHHYNIPYNYGLMTQHPSNSKLLKFRTGSSRPNSARVRVLLQSTLNRDPGFDID